LWNGFNFTELHGGTGNDRLRTDADFLIAGGANQTLRFAQFGDEGNDTLSTSINVRALDPEDSFFAADAEMRLSGGLGRDVLTARVNLGGTASGVFATVLSGGAGDDQLISDLQTPFGTMGVAFAARLYGGDGADRIQATAGAVGLDRGVATNRIWGGADDDLIEAFAYTNGLRLGPAVNEIDGGSGHDWIRARTDAITNVGVNSQRNTIWGGIGDDVIEAGHDFGSNGSGRIDNIVDGGSGRDRVNAWIDHADYREQYWLEAVNDVSGGSGDDVLRARIDAVAYDRLEATNDLAGGSGNDSLRAEIIVGFSNENSNPVLITRSELRGGSGDDVLTVAGGQTNLLDGGIGADRMTGGTGNETYVVDTFRDVTIEAAGASGGTDTVRAWVNHRLAAGIENLALAGTDLRGIGNGLANVLTGNATDNRLVGLEGADRLVGGGGSDLLEGGAGADTIVVDLRPGRTGVLTLADFSRNADILEFVGLEDEGAPGLVDDLDALADFDDAGPGGLLQIAIGGIDLRLPGRGTGAVDSFADIVANPATQLVTDDLFA
jgi:Ca2+-binding RTX toxin-like protein